MAKILLVDDAEFVRMKARKILLEAGYSDIAEASNGQDAIEQYNLYRPDLVMLDITMPVKDGLTALRELKQLDPQAKVVMVSAIGQKATVLEAIKAGASDFVLKPYDPEKLVAAVKKQVG